ncbi:hypothetical protein [Aliirhizobium smilacinae]|uniref:Uncharacterized protein n=1 Tax=Aliirhizobium smilacinae TaxID=1395944 RepID=A0A5C4XF49_9HYPH|nr:hypothetical protein [Rhizobium smilacinae]TNM62143.1 hypothetical protein FHP24_18800 [Rhizobium smilacinae]
MNGSIFNNRRALLGGVFVAIVVVGAVQLVLAVRGPQYATQSDPGTIIVRPIVKDDATKNLTMSVVVGLAGGVIAARAIHRRRRKS